LITGATGFIGRHVCAQLTRDQHQICAALRQPQTHGHSATGALDNTQPLFALLDNLARGRMAMVPNSPARWLPLVAVDRLAALIALAATTDNAPPHLLARSDDAI